MDAAGLTLAPTPLEAWGWDVGFEAAFAEHRGAASEPARVVSATAGGQRVMTASGERSAAPSGRLRHAAALASEMPAVGD